MKIRKLRPRYTHDCAKCVLLGSIVFPAPHRVTLTTGEKKCWTESFAADLYVCLAGGEQDVAHFGRTIIARHASEGAQYSSCPSAVIRDGYMRDEQSTFGPALIAGYWFAVAAGHVKHEVAKR